MQILNLCILLLRTLGLLGYNHVLNLHLIVIKKNTTEMLPSRGKISNDLTVSNLIKPEA